MKTTKKVAMRWLTPVLLFVVVSMFSVLSLFQFNVFRGQIAPEEIVVLSPKGEALQLDLSRSSWSSGPTPMITVAWTRTMMNGKNYVISISNLATGKLLRQITVSYSSLPDRMNPTYQLPATGFVPYTEYAISVSVTGGAIPNPPSPPSIFWVGVKDMPSYELQQPSILGPTGEVTSASALATWTSLDPRTRTYHVELSEPDSLNTFSVSTRSLPDINSPSFSFASKMTLKQNVQYRFRVRGEDMNRAKSLWSDYGTFTVNEDVFSQTKPTAISPAGPQHYFDNTFRWNPVEGAKYYRVEVRGSNNQLSFTQTVYTQNLVDKSKPSLTIYNFPVNDKNTYVWYVVAYSMNETMSQSSDMVSFSSLLDSFADKKPVALGPTGTVDKNSVKFSWQKLPYAVGYNVSIAAGSKSYLKRVNVSDVGEPDVYAISFPDLPIEYDTQYTFTVRAFDAKYVNSQSSDPVSFRTATNDFLSIVPEVIGPKGSVTSFDSTISWKRVPGADQYRINFFTESGFSKPFSYSKYLLASSFPDGDTLSLKIPDCPLDAGITFWYQIQARNKEGWHSKPSLETRFTIALSEFAQITPEAIAPHGIVSLSPGVSVELTWKAVPSAVSYFVKIYRGDGFQKDVEVPVSTLVTPERPSLIFDQSLIIANGTYAFSVLGKNAQGITTKVSIPLNFSFTEALSSSTSTSSTASADFAKSKPRITGPRSGSPETSNITWDEVLGATSYGIWVKDYSLGSDTTVLNVSLPLSAIGDPHAPSMHTDSIFKKRGIYTVWVRAERQFLGMTKKELSLWSRGLAFVAGVGTYGDNTGGELTSMRPVVSVPVSPSSTMPTITWEAIPGVGAYHLYVKNASTNRVEKILALSSDELSYQFTYPLQSGKKYSVWLRAQGAGDFSAWSILKTFTVK